MSRHCVVELRLDIFILADLKKRRFATVDKGRLYTNAKKSLNKI